MDSKTVHSAIDAPPGVPGVSKKGWRQFVDNDISWTLFFEMGDFSWTFPKGDF